ncbi:MAG: acyltransferase family protein, partial [Planctomycetes bacterium]|nr:acyltransferase family protein [Planctomycetota bacterium]
MGAFRILLCWLVIAAHVDPATSGAVRFAGPFALFSFFAVSGYYMTLTLRTTYAVPGGLRAYYFNRALRILPLYVALLVVCAPFAFVNDNPTHAAWTSLKTPSAVIAAIAQIQPIGQE